MNIIERLIKLTVNNSEANTALKKTATNLDKVDKNTTKVTQSTKTMTKETRSSTEAIVSNGGAMGILNDLTGGLAMTFKDASEAIGLAGVSLNSFKGIMIATGIGAFVVLVGYLASHWEDVSEFIGLSNKELEKHSELMSKAIGSAAVLAQEAKTIFENIDLTNLEEANILLDKLKEKVPALKDLKPFGDAQTNKENLKLIEEALNIFSTYSEMVNRVDVARNDFEEKRIQYQKTGSLADKTKMEAAKALFNEEYKVLLNFEKQNGAIIKQIDSIKKRGLTKDEEAKEDRIREDKLQAFIDSYLNKTEDLYADTEAKKIDLQEKRALLELALLEGTERQKQIILNYYAEVRRIAAEKEFKARMTEIDSQSAARIESGKKENEEFKNQVSEWAKEFISKKEFEKELEVETQKTKFQAWLEYWNDVAMVSETSQGFLQALQDESLIKSKEVRTAMLLVEKGLAIANVWINEAQATAVAKFNASQVPDFVYLPNGLSVPNPAKPIAVASAIRTGVANKINAGIATATILAQTIASFSKSSSGGGGTGGAGASAQPQAQFNIVGSSGNNQLAAAIGSAQNKPVNAYVVGSDMTTQQALDRNRITTATFL